MAKLTLRIALPILNCSKGFPALFINETPFSLHPLKTSSVFSQCRKLFLASEGDEQRRPNTSLRRIGYRTAPQHTRKYPSAFLLRRRRRYFRRGTVSSLWNPFCPILQKTARHAAVPRRKPGDFSRLRQPFSARPQLCAAALLPLPILIRTFCLRLLWAAVSASLPQLFRAVPKRFQYPH